MLKKLWGSLFLFLFWTKSHHPSLKPSRTERPPGGRKSVPLCPRCMSSSAWYLHCSKLQLLTQQGHYSFTIRASCWKVCKQEAGTLYLCGGKKQSEIKNKNQRQLKKKVKSKEKRRGGIIYCVICRTAAAGALVTQLKEHKLTLQSGCWLQGEPREFC